MHQILLADITVLSPFVEHFKTQGGCAEGILEGNRIPLGALEQGHGKITKLQFYNTVEAMARSAGAADFGYQVGRLFQPKDMGALGVAVSQASTLLDALRTLQSYVHQWVEGTEIQLRQEGDRVWLIDHGCDGLSKFRCHTGQATVFFLTNLVRLVAGDDWAPIEVKTEALYIDALHIHQDFSNTEIHYQCDCNAIAIPSGLLKLPMPKAQAIDSGLSHEKLSLHDQLKEIIRTQIIDGHLLLAHDAAEITGTSERSFMRQLAGQGISYRQILDRTRYEIATDLLKQGLNTSEVARLLHYSGSNNFIRAFKRITGQTPQQWLRS